MKLALVFLSALIAAISNQQIQHRGANLQLIWLPPYFPHGILNNYQLLYNYNYLDKADEPLRIFQPIGPIIYSQNEGFNQDSIDSVNQYNITENKFPDTHQRVNGLNSPIFTDEMQDQRLLFFGFSSTSLRNPFFRTATFTLTSTVTLAVVQSCIAEGDFLDALAQVTPCRRKRNILDYLAIPDNAQFSIKPSETQQLTPTMIPSFDQEIRELPNNQGVYRDIVSSKEDIGQRALDEMTGFMSPESNLNKEKRFIFNYFVASTTLTSYSFMSTTFTKTVDLGIDEGINCLPTGYLVC